MNTERSTWDSMYMSMCYLISTRSIDPYTRVGAVVVSADRSVRAIGYNGLARGVELSGNMVNGIPKELTPENQQQYIVHAELNCIINAGRNATSLVGCTMYCPLAPCVSCGKSIIQSGITELVLHQTGTSIFTESKKAKSNQLVNQHPMILTMLEDAGVDVRWVDEILPQAEMLYSSTKYSLNGEML